MRRPDVKVITVVLVIAWQCSSIKMTAVAQPLADEQEDDGFDPPESPLPEYPPTPANETPKPALPTRKSQTLVEWSPSSPWPETPTPPRIINRTACGRTTMLVFGDSTVDPGNNNQLETAAKANFLPYGMSFYGGKPTGRFSNGRLITDMLAEKLGRGRSIPGFHDPKLKPGQLRTAGVSFASAGSGYDDATAKRSVSR